MRIYLLQKKKIEGYQDVAQTVKAVEKIAATHIHFLKKTVFRMNKYAETVEMIIQRLSEMDIKNKNKLFIQRPKGFNALIVITGNKGLAGNIWHNTVNFVVRKKSDYDKIFVLGQKGFDYLREEGLEPEKVFSQFSDIPKQVEIAESTDFIFNFFINNPVKKMDIIYPAFKSVSVQEPQLIPFLPFQLTGSIGNSVKIQGQKIGLPIYEPEKVQVFNWFLQKYIEIFFYKIIMEVKLSEFSSRTLAMENADSRTAALIKQLKLGLNKERRRSSTQKQIESFIVHKVA